MDTDLNNLLAQQNRLLALPNEDIKTYLACRANPDES
jgi:hypothetical protein